MCIRDRYSIEDKEGFAKDLDELLAIETEVGIHTVSEEEIEKCDDPRYDCLLYTSRISEIILRRSHRGLCMLDQFRISRKK